MLVANSHPRRVSEPLVHRLKGWQILLETRPPHGMEAPLMGLRSGYPQAPHHPGGLRAWTAAVRRSRRPHQLNNGRVRPQLLRGVIRLPTRRVPRIRHPEQVDGSPPSALHLTLRLQPRLALSRERCLRLPAPVPRLRSFQRPQHKGLEGTAHILHHELMPLLALQQEMGKDLVMAGWHTFREDTTFRVGIQLSFSRMLVEYNSICGCIA